MKNRFLLLFFLFCTLISFAQKDQRLAQGLSALSGVEKVVMPRLNNEDLLATELQSRAPNRAPRFAENIEVHIQPETHGTWTIAPNGNRVWRLVIESKGAKSLNLGFSKYNMPKGGTLVLYSPDYKHIMGPFTPADNEEHEQLWTPVLPGDQLVIEVRLPSEAEKSMLELELSFVNHDFLGFGAAASGSCNIDVICGALDGWAQVDEYRDIIRSVAVIGTGGGTFCTGFLVNNALQDCTPFFMTANHCGITAGNAASLVTYWNYENSYCRVVGSGDSGNPGDGDLTDFNTGAIFRAGNGNSDFTLVELDDPVSPTANAFFAGWSNEPLAPSSAIAVHHPQGEEKRISFENDPLMLTLYQGTSTASNFTHVRVVDWDDGTTEPGSSGSPLFDQNKRVVGQLHGGGAACGNDQSDWYGAFAVSWEGGSAATRLRDWLDPDNAGITVLDGREWEACQFFVEGTPAAIEVCAPSDTVFQISVSESFTNDVALTVSSDIPGTGILVLNDTIIAPGATTELSLSVEGTVSTGVYTIEISGTDGIETVSSSIEVLVFAAAPAAPVLISPPDGEMDVSTIPPFSWTVMPTGTEFSLEIATDINFTNIIETLTGLTGNSYSGSTLDILTTYYWRLRGTNLCGNGNWSEIFSFTTAEILCNTDSSVDVPVSIPSSVPTSEGVTVSSTLEITDDGSIIDISVENVDINHTWVGDLVVTLESPSGTIVTLMDRPGVPASGFGCEEDNLLVTFTDEATATYDEFDNTCNTGPFAIEGVFQPVQPLSTFINESPLGTWTLSVTDYIDLDGGQLNGWSLNICSTALADYGLEPSVNESTFCINDSTSFELYLGEDFDPAGVNLTASGNPAGSTVNFSANPAMPGDTVSVSIANVNAPGNYTISFNASDGTNATDTEINITILDLPGNVVLSTPFNGALDVIPTPTLTWIAAAEANTYFVELSDFDDFSNIIASNTQTGTSFTTPMLNEEQSYFWRVSAENDCGSSISEVFSFTVVGDLSFIADPAILDACVGDNIVFSLSVGSGFNDTGTALTYSVSPDPAFDFSFNIPDPNNVTPGTVVEATLEGVAAPGEYTIQFMVEDGAHTGTATIFLTLEGPLSIASLQSPANNESGVVLNPTLNWTAVDNVDDYFVEISTDDQFINIVEDATVLNPFYIVTTTLEEFTRYYWRVSAQNHCGGSLSQAFSFTTVLIESIDELNEVEVNIRPNPTDGKLFITLSEALSEELTVSIYAINGQMLQHQIAGGQQTNIELSLDNYAKGVYLLQLISAEEVLTKRIVLQQ